MPLNPHLIELHNRAVQCEAEGFEHLAKYCREEIGRFVKKDVELNKQAASLAMLAQSKTHKSEPTNEINNS